MKHVSAGVVFFPVIQYFKLATKIVSNLKKSYICNSKQIRKNNLNFFKFEKIEKNQNFLKFDPTKIGTNGKN